ncbi:conserved hypothetical protein [Gammaproteobacteria bacterium]
MSRKYNKRSDYWGKFSKAQEGQSEPLDAMLRDNASEPSLVGDPFYQQESKASSYERSGGGESTSLRRNLAYVGPKIYKYGNIREGMLPFETSINGYNIRDAIELCQKAYANIAIFRNAVDIMSEFANAEIYLEGGSQKSKDFFSKWMKYTRMWNVKDQYFREYYRSGNVFFYKINAKFDIDDFQKILETYASYDGASYNTDIKLYNYPTPYDVKNLIPVQYTLLNPYYLTTNHTSSWHQIVYQKILSEYELERLRSPKNDHDKVVFDSLDNDTKEKIRLGQWARDGLKIQLNPTDIIYSFYKKQDYEPFAIPFGFAVLDDINFKMEMKKIDQAICRTIENVILLITMGTEPTKGGINHKNIKAMQNLLSNQSVGRVLVADYTTKAEFIIPDMNKVLGYEKYKVVNEDIKEGLQNILIGSEKFANTTVKAQVFFERLKEARKAFLNDFLQPEMELIFRNLGFKGKCPIAKFEEVSIKDETQFNRVVTRMMELGILPPEEGLRVIETGIYPTKEELGTAQAKFVEERKKGYYNPIVGGVPVIAPPVSEASGVKPVMKKTTTPTERGRPVGSNASVYAKDAIAKVMDKTKDLYSIVEVGLKKKYSKKSLNAEQNKLAQGISEAIILGSQSESWISLATEVLNDPNKLDKLNILSEIQTTAGEHDLDTYAAALLYHSTKYSV